MRLSSGIAKHYKKSFVLDEDALRRLHGVLDKALRDLDTPSTTVFRIEREDDRFYESTDLEDVLADPNVGGKRICNVVLEIRAEDEDDDSVPSTAKTRVAVGFRLRDKEGPFPVGDSVRIVIATEDRNWALLLADELEPQIMRTFRAQRTPRWLLALAVASVLVLATATLARLAPKATVPNSSLWTISLAIGFAFGLFYFLVRFSGSPGVFARLFGPESVYLWGDEAQSYPMREQNRRNIQWAVIVAFLVSLATSGYISYMTWAVTSV